MESHPSANSTKHVRSKFKWIWISHFYSDWGQALPSLIQNVSGKSSSKEVSESIINYPNQLYRADFVLKFLFVALRLNTVFICFPSIVCPVVVGSHPAGTVYRIDLSSSCDDFCTQAKTRKQQRSSRWFASMTFRWKSGRQFSRSARPNATQTCGTPRSCTTSSIATSTSRATWSGRCQCGLQPRREGRRSSTWSRKWCVRRRRRHEPSRKTCWRSTRINRTTSAGKSRQKQHRPSSRRNVWRLDGRRCYGPAATRTNTLIILLVCICCSRLTCSWCQVLVIIIAEIQSRPP